MPRLQARTIAEAHLYMELRPCSCGESRFDWSLNTSDGVSCSYTGPCARCQQPRAFEFEIIEPTRPVTEEVDFGSGQSRLLDPGEWMEVALERAKVHQTRDELAFARAALEEVIKFLPEGAEEVPAAAFTSERGRALHAATPWPFLRIRLRASLHAWDDIIKRYDVDRLCEAIAATDTEAGRHMAEVRRRERETN